MEEEMNKTGHGLGVAALITAIITFVLAIIPCVGILAIIPGMIAIILAIVGIPQASRNHSPQGMLIAGLIIAVIALMISFSQIFVIGKVAHKFDKFPNGIENIINEVQDNVIKDLEDASVSIKVESNGEKVEIKTDSNKKNLELKLEDLEGGKSVKNDTLQKTK